jgi:hypothetical protein
VGVKWEQHQLHVLSLRVVAADPKDHLIFVASHPYRARFIYTAEPTFESLGQEHKWENLLRPEWGCGVLLKGFAHFLERSFSSL